MGSPVAVPAAISHLLIHGVVTHLAPIDSLSAITSPSSFPSLPSSHRSLRDRIVLAIPSFLHAARAWDQRWRQGNRRSPIHEGVILLPPRAHRRPRRPGPEPQPRGQCPCDMPGKTVFWSAILDERASHEPSYEPEPRYDPSCHPPRGKS